MSVLNFEGCELGDAETISPSEKIKQNLHSNPSSIKIKKAAVSDKSPSTSETWIRRKDKTCVFEITLLTSE